MPFFQGATDFEINGGNFYDVKGNQVNKHYDQSFKVDGQNNTATYAPNYSRQDNRAYNMNYNNMDMHSYGSGSGQNYAGGAYPQQHTAPPISYEQYQMHLFAQAYANLQLHGHNLPQAAAQPQRLSHSNNPQIADRPFDNSGDPNRILGTNRTQQPSPQPQQQIPPRSSPPNSFHYPPAPLPFQYPSPPSWASQQQFVPQHPSPYSTPTPPRSHSLGPSPPNLPGFDAFNEPSSVFSGQDPALPGFSALMGLQDRFSQQAQSSGPTGPSSPQPPTSSPPTSPTTPTANPIPQPSVAQSVVQQQNAPPQTTTPAQPPPRPNMQTRPAATNRPPSQSSSSSSSSDSSDDEDSGKNTSWNRPPHAMPTVTPSTGPVQAAPVNHPSPPPAAPSVQIPQSNMATSPFLHENTSPLGAPVGPAANIPLPAQPPAIPTPSTTTNSAPARMTNPSSAPQPPFPQFLNVHPPKDSTSPMSGVNSSLNAAPSVEAKKKQSLLKKMGNKMGLGKKTKEVKLSAS